MPEKPTGNIGPIKLETKPNSVKASWEVIDFSKEKREIENKIVEKFRHSGEKAGFVFEDAEHVFENIFFLNMLDDNHSEIRVLYPIANNAILEDSKLDELKNSQYLNLDPKKWNLIT